MDAATGTALDSRATSSESAEALAVGKSSATSRTARSQPRSVQLPVPEVPQAAGSARPLEPTVRALMERAFSTDFSTVRVHETSHVEELEAVAYAQGEDLFFAPGTYQPHTEQGRELIGHELAHVVQQRQRRSAVPQGKGAPIDADPALEREADEQGARAARGEVVVNAGSAPLAGAAPISRKPTKWTEIELTSDGKAKWVPHKTQPKTTDDRGAFDGEGKGMNVLGTQRADDKWVTAITPKPSTIGSGGVRVDKLGPDHPRGAPANPAKLPHLSKLDSKAATAAKSASLGVPPAYVAELVLPEALGGDGSKLHHLVALPPDAAAELRRVHALLIKLVEQQKGWITFDSWVMNTQDSGTLYPASVKLRWMELDALGASVPGTTGVIELKLPTPTAWGQAAGGTAVDAPDQLGVHDNRAKSSLGALRRDDQTAVRFQSRIHWEPTFGNGDGTKMVANPLGPDHKIGEEPVAGDHIWNRRTRALRAAAKQSAADTYVAGHLLNHHLGGPGNDPRNLAAIPSDANKAHLNEVETPIKHLVNDDKAWVYYSVEVQQKTDNAATGGPVDYASAFICRWHQLDDHGVEIPNTHGAKTVDIKAPSQYSSHDSEVTDDGTETKADKLRKATARSRLGYDELVLEDSDTLKPQRNAMAPLVKVLQEMELHGDFIHEDVKQSVELVVESVRPRTDEKDALEGIAKLSGELEKLAATASVEELAKLLPLLTKDLIGHTQKAEDEMRHRHGEAQKVAKLHLSKRFLPEKAQKLGEALETSMSYDSKAFFTMVEMVKQLVQFAEKSMTHAVEHRQGLFQSAATLREWLGAPPPDTSSTASELQDDVQSLFFEGLSNIDSIYNFSPMSPGTWQDFGESVVGSSVRGGTVSETQGMVLHHMTQPMSGRGEKLDLSGFTPHDGLARMQKLLEAHGDKWPKGVKTGNVATLIELLAPTYKSNPSAAQFALSSYYFMAPDEFLDYLAALEKL